MRCFYCGNELNEEEHIYNIKNAEYCCSGLDCGCMGMPIEPPCCFKCDKSKEELK